MWKAARRRRIRPIGENVAADEEGDHGHWQEDERHAEELGLKNLQEKFRALLVVSPIVFVFAAVVIGKQFG